MTLGILPPKKDACQECATKHKASEPHNLHSLYYQMQFRLKNGRKATWEDAMSHCDKKTKEMWREELEKAGEIPARG